MQISLRDIDNIIEKTGTKKDAVIPVLQAIQARYNYLPEEALRRVCDITEITPEQITGVSGFYSQFRFKPAGKHLIKVCVGTACHVKGAVQVYDAFKRELGLFKDQDTDKKGIFTIEKVNCLGCCTLAPVVQIDNVTYGHVSTNMVKNVLRDFELSRRSNGNKKYFRKGTGESIEGEIRIGLGSCCVASGSEAVHEKVIETVHDLGLDLKIKHVGCVGMCHQVPLMEIVTNGGESSLYAKVQPLDVKKILTDHFQPAGLLNRFYYKLINFIENIRNDSEWESIEKYSLDVRDKHVSVFLGRQVPIATEYRGIINPLDLNEYMQKNGFRALRKCLTELSSHEIINEIKNSGLRGRGGAGFLTGNKWDLVARQQSSVKYIICNGDEGDPGAFMDRMLL